MAHIGVENRTEEVQYLTYDGKMIRFGKKEVRLVEGVPPDFVETRINVSHIMKENKETGEKIQTPQLQGVRIFKVLTIDEALKAGARPDEDPRAMAIRAAAMEKAKERQMLLNDLKADLVEAGWVAPKKDTLKKEKKEEDPI